jgi:hypothetical protein
MATLTKRSTIYFDADLHKALRIKSAETARPISELVNDAVRQSLVGKNTDTAALEERAKAKRSALINQVCGKYRSVRTSSKTFAERKKTEIELER